nr:unnamed protein product [Spirometra erinaceieuropaei]
MGDNPSEPSTSLSHPACSIGPSVGSEETSSWHDGKVKRHNGSIEPQTTPVDLLRPSADKATGNRKNEPLDRQHCVVVQGLSESDAPTPKERISADLNMLQHLLNEMLNSNEKITIRAAFRIGKKHTTLHLLLPLLFLLLLFLILLLLLLPLILLLLLLLLLLPLLLLLLLSPLKFLSPS